MLEMTVVLFIIFQEDMYIYICFFLVQDEHEQFRTKKPLSRDLTHLCRLDTSLPDYCISLDRFIKK